MNKQVVIFMQLFYYTLILRGKLEKAKSMHVQYLAFRFRCSIFSKVFVFIFFKLSGLNLYFNLVD